MSKEKLDKLIEKYEAGKTTTSEENILKNSNHSSMENDLWFKYQKSEEIIVPNDLEDSIMKSISEKSKKRSISLYKLGSIAASIILIASFSLVLFKNNPPMMSEEEKQKKYEEALNMLFDNTNEVVEQTILFETNNLVFYIEK